ncbi:sugar phosphate nucleotidyltransferase [Cytobacillus gottheilii]|uniref:sugar phosphate nucleotidyltransferase n=1 Tax=Cytobacillus gottheilii TaxID=859144 RepID=UPI0009BC312E|nr:sugar phosphate nucleotidyltransferase [Cytobacillus gottheilii]
MNTDGLKIIRELKKNQSLTQRDISALCDFSLGKTNKLFTLLMKEDLLMKTSTGYSLSAKAHEVMEDYLVDNAIILAAGFGSRFVPLTYETPKGLLEVCGERMIERQIQQLLEMSITDITIVVGYLKEKFDYLIDKYGVKLIYNAEYDTKNNLSTLYHVRHLLKNTYILSSDNYMTKNLFNTYELHSWYTAVKTEGETAEWCLTTDQKDKIKKIEVGGVDSWHMYGPVFFSKKFSEKIVPLLEQTYAQPGTEDFYWEDVLKQNLNVLEMYVNRQPEDTVYEFESFEELREFDATYRDHSKNQVLSLIGSIFNIREEEIKGIQPLKLGMTNKSFLFGVNDRKYICRLPGEGTEKLINREEEHRSIEAVIPLNITENIVYMDANSGIKISEFETDARSLDISSDLELFSSMKTLHKLHHSDITVSHHFDIEKNIQYYEELCNKNNANLFEDYLSVRTKMDELITILNKLDLPSAFSHIDPHLDNFLVLPNGDLKLIDWEYAGMCDPVIDLSMFALYGHLDHEQLEKIMDFYFDGSPTNDERLRVYIYMALGGFLWAMWAQYKQALGVKFGDYTLNMYRYAKNYYKKSMGILTEDQTYEFAKK